MVFIQKMFMSLLIWILQFLDTLFKMFGFLAGTEKVGTNDGSESTLVEIFLGADTVTQVFMGIFLMSIILCAVCIVIAVVKNTINLSAKERKPHGRTVGQGVISILGTLIMAIVMIGGIAVSNAALVEINKQFVKAQSGNTIGAMIFDISVEETYKVDYEQPAYEYDENNEVVKDENGNKVISYYEYAKDPVTGKYLVESGWINGKMPLDFDISSLTARKVYGTFNRNMIWLEVYKDKPGKNALIKYDSFNFFIAYFGAVIMLVVVSISMLGLVKRLFDIVILFFALPIVMATVPLDDGAKFKQWRETVVSKVILAYGAVFAINIFLLMIPLLLNTINFVALSEALGTKFLAQMFRLLLIVGGALAINGGQLLFARLLGTSAEESREMTQALRGAIAGTMAAGGSVRGLKNLVLGGRNKYGAGSKGLLYGAAKVAGGAANVAGNMLGGNAYRGVATKVGAGATRLQNAIRGMASAHPGGNAQSDSMSANKFMKSNGLIGGTVGAPAGVKKKVAASSAKASQKSVAKKVNDWISSEQQNGVIISPPSQGAKEMYDGHGASKIKNKIKRGKK